MLNLIDLNGFEWDEGNRQKNYAKHGVTNKEAEEVFENVPLIMIKSKYKNEDRYQAFGESKNGKLLIIIYTLRNKTIRIISARPQSKIERNFYYGKLKEEKIKTDTCI
ncbi:MAG: BrnT family toxin [Ignavibacteria bacterium]|nr:BrnT family toxin [Ignavibacteria bacterium]